MTIADGKSTQLTETPKRPARNVGRLLEGAALPIILILVVVFFSILPASSGTFPTSANWNVMTANQAVIALIAVGEIFPLICGSFDFSVGTSAATASVAAATSMSRFHAPVGVAILVALTVGLIVGVVNGVLVGRMGLSAIVITLGVATLLSGLISWYTAGQAIVTNISPTLTNLGSLKWLGIPRVLFVVAAASILIWYLIERTPAGRRLQSIGSNARAARLVGIGVERYVFGSFLASGLLAGVAGVILVARQGGATSDDGTSLLFPALTAVFLGATSIKPGRFNVPGTLIAVLLVATTVSGLTLAGAQTWVSSVFNGSALVIAVLLSTLLARSRGDSGIL